MSKELDVLTIQVAANTNLKASVLQLGNAIIQNTPLQNEYVAPIVARKTPAGEIGS